MPATYEPIATTTVSGSTTNIVTFSSIPGTYTDIRLTAVSQGASGGMLSLRFNSDTATNYSYTSLSGQGTTTSTISRNSQAYIRDEFTSVPSASTGQWGFQAYDIFNYAGSTFKTCLFNGNRDENGSGSVGNNVGMWRSTSAITSISVYINNGTTTNYNFSAGTVITLYGIKAA